MTGDQSRSETCRVGSGRPRGGCFRVDDGVEYASLPLRKRGRVVPSEGATFSDFRGVENEVCSEKQNRKKR